MIFDLGFLTFDLCFLKKQVFICSKFLIKGTYKDQKSKIKDQRSTSYLKLSLIAR